MAVTRRIDRKPKKASKPKEKDDYPIALPTTKNKPPGSIFEYSMIIYGAKGIGKTTLAASFPDAVVFMLEPRRRNLSIMQIPKPGEPPLTFHRIEQYAKLLVKERGKKGGTIVFDTVDRLYDLCTDQVCRENGVKHPNDANDYGKTWEAIKKRFESLLINLSGYFTLVYTSHDTIRTVTSATGEDYDLIVPSCKAKAWDFLKAACDIALYFGYHGKKRAFTVRGNDLVWSACNLEDRFLTPKGEPLTTFLAGETPKEAYTRLLKAFDNKVVGVKVTKAADEEE